MMIGEGVVLLVSFGVVVMSISIAVSRSLGRNAGALFVATGGVFYLGTVALILNIPQKIAQEEEITEDQEIYEVGAHC